jgi:hypothetical protein
MLISDSMSLLWMTYAFLSLVVLVSGYLGLAFLPRLPRLVITWMVAGVMWIPSRFELPLLEEGETYTGLAPAVMVAAIAFLESNGPVLFSALLLVLVGALAGALLGVGLWWRRRHGQHIDMPERGYARPAGRTGREERREPVVG